MLMILAALLAAQPSGIRADAAQVTKEGEHLASEPARDVGVKRIEIPQILQSARTAPYAAPASPTCAGIASEISGLNEALGPDIAVPVIANRHKVGRFAEQGGEAVVDSVIPFRGLVREASGAAAAQRRLNEAIDAGYARRGYLHGLATARRCRSKS